MKKLLMIFIVMSLLPGLIGCEAAHSKIAVIPLSGVIQQESRLTLLGGTSITPGLVRQYLARAQKDPAVQAVVIQLNTPGGDVSACQEIVYELQRLKKPVVVSMQSIATSGGYYISAKARRIVALPTTLTGSIGVISEIPSLKGLFDKIGVKMDVIKAGKYKDMYAGVRDLSPEELQIMQDTTNEMYEQFIDIVAEGRRMDKSKVRELATGQAYTGKQALQLGLVDELGGLQTAIDSAAGIAGIKEPVVETYRQDSPGLLQLISNMSSGTAGGLLGIGTLSVENLMSLELLGNSYPRFSY
jgi:protease-4